MLASVRSGDWLAPERLRIYPLIFLGIFTLLAIGVVATSRDRMGPNNLPLGSDFSQVWVAGKEVLAGHPDAPYDITRHAAAQREEFGEKTGVFGWHYPPFFLAPAAWLAHLPYLQALALWQFATLGLYLISIVVILTGSGVNRRAALVAALAFPAVIINLGHGQNGFFTAALIGGGFFLLERRPLIAGALFAMLTYKPQFALALPIALLIGRHWRAMASAGATFLFMTIASIATFGLASWRAFFDNLGFTRAIVEQGMIGFEKIQSVFAAVRLMGGGVAVAYFWQGVATTFALTALAWLLRSAADARVKAAATISAMLLSTPYMLDYDMVALAPAMALLLSHGIEEGFQPYEKSALAYAFVAPLLVRPVAMLLPLPLGVIAIALLFVSTVRYALPSEYIPARNA